MTSHHEILLDVASGIESESDGISLVSSSSNGSIGYSRKRLSGGLSDGVDLITLESGETRVFVVPTRGMGVWKIESGDIRIGWDSPVDQLVHPKFVDQGRRGGIGWLDGFNELICRCGLASNGAPGPDDCGTQLDLHGRIANLAAHRLEIQVDAGGVELTGWVTESSLFGPRLELKSSIRLSADCPRISIVDVVTNRGGQDAEVELLYHTNIGTPVLGEGARFLAASSEVVPRDARAVEGIDGWSVYRGPEAGYAEQCYFLSPKAGADGMSTVLLQNSSADLGVSMRFPVSELPSFTLWKNTQATEDGYCTGLEPGMDLPNHRSFERANGRLKMLAPGDSCRTSFDLEVEIGDAAVSRVGQEIAELQGDAGPTVHPDVDPAWSPA